MHRVVSKFATHKNKKSYASQIRCGVRTQTIFSTVAGRIRHRSKLLRFPKLCLCDSAHCRLGEIYHHFFTTDLLNLDNELGGNTELNQGSAGHRNSGVIIDWCEIIEEDAWQVHGCLNVKAALATLRAYNANAQLVSQFELPPTQCSL